MKTYGIVILWMIFLGVPAACGQQRTIRVMDFEVQKTSEEWKTQLSDMQYYVLREKGTERAFTGKYWDYKGVGVYGCAGCGCALFASKTKFKSGTGWPSFYAPVEEKSVRLEVDRSFGMLRQEVVCGRCGGHLGHLFDDGPPPTGLRYCINSAALTFEKSTQTLKKDANSNVKKR